jgi:hypothetical protein
MHAFCGKNKLPQPSFVVIQTGTRVFETRNTGALDAPVRVANELPPEIQVPKMIEICNRYGVFMKQHNTDYLSEESLCWHPRLGIHAANVAPEFGVIETRALLEALEGAGLKPLSERFLKLAYDSRKWEKWLLPDSRATDRERAVIAGHYVFSVPEGLAIKEEARSALAPSGKDLDGLLKAAVKAAVLRYMRCFRMVRNA